MGVTDGVTGGEMRYTVSDEYTMIASFAILRDAMEFAHKTADTRNQSVTIFVDGEPTYYVNPKE